MQHPSGDGRVWHKSLVWGSGQTKMSSQRCVAPGLGGHIQERVTGEGVEGSMEVAHLASTLASSLLGMAVYPETQWTVMVELVLFISVAISWMSRAVSCLGPRFRCVV
jgi:hypothetical protein